MLTINQAAHTLGLSRQTLVKYLRLKLIKGEYFTWDTLPDDIKVEMSSIRISQIKRQGIVLIDDKEVENWLKQAIPLSVVPPYISMNRAAQMFGLTIGTLRTAYRRNRLATTRLWADEAITLLREEGQYNSHTKRNIKLRGLIVTSVSAIEQYLASKQRKT